MTSGCFDSLLKLHFTLTATQLVLSSSTSISRTLWNNTVWKNHISTDQEHFKHISTNRKNFYCIYDIYDVNLWQQISTEVQLIHAEQMSLWNFII